MTTIILSDEQEKRLKELLTVETINLNTIIVLFDANNQDDLSKKMHQHRMHNYKVFHSILDLLR